MVRVLAGEVARGALSASSMSSGLQVYRRITRGPLSRRCPPFGKSLISLANAPPWFSSALQIVYWPSLPTGSLGTDGRPYRPIGRRTAARPVAGRSSVDEEEIAREVVETDIELIALEIALVDSNARPNI